MSLNHGILLVVFMRYCYIVVKQEEIAKYDKICEEAYAAAKKEISYSNADWLDSPWEGFFDNVEAMRLPKTGVKEEILQYIGEKFSSPPPEDFHIHGGNLILLKESIQDTKECVTKK